MFVGKALGPFWALSLPHVVGNGAPVVTGTGGGLPYLAWTSAVLGGQMEVPGLLHPYPHFFCTVWVWVQTAEVSRKITFAFPTFALAELCVRM